MDGVLVVDKPAGLTSHDVVAAVRRATGEKRIGHTGTLDPLATGVLPLACGRATRLVRFLTASDKDYEAVIRFGVTTTTYDSAGEEVTRSNRMPTRAAITGGLAALQGTYDQQPPAFSAKRIGGQRAYALARKAQPVALNPVSVTVTRAELLALSGETATVAVTCSAGFYVRSFAHALGERTGTGACLESLRRTRSGDFTLSDAEPLEQVMTRGDAAADSLVPFDRLLPRFAMAIVTAEGRERLRHGRELTDAHLLERRGAAGGDPAWVRLCSEAGELLAMARAVPHGALQPSVVLI